MLCMNKAWSFMSNSSFKPAWWLPSSHLQTVWPVLFRRLHNIKLNRERVELPDGDFVDLDWAGKKTKNIVIILHGLEGSAQSSYAQGLLAILSEHKDFQPVVMHFRGCSGEQNRLPRFYHSGDTQDIAYVVNFLKQREPHASIFAVGFSMGGNVLLKWLGETGVSNPLIAAVAISTPFELNKCVQRLRYGFSRVYDWYLLKRLRQKALNKFSVALTNLVNLEIIKSSRTLNEFDECITAPLHGFSNAQEYYEKSSSRQYLKTIGVPTLLLQAKDDPFMSADVIPEINELSTSVTLEVTEKRWACRFCNGKSSVASTLLVRAKNSAVLKFIFVIKKALF